MNRAVTNTLTHSPDDYFNVIKCYIVRKLQDHGAIYLNIELSEV